MNRRIVAKSATFGKVRADKELAIFAHAHNCGTEVTRGFCDRDFYGDRYWVEQEVCSLWTNVAAPPPGGNLRMPAQPPAGAPEDWNGGTEVMGQAYLDEYRRGQLKECAKRLGLDLDYLENLKRTSFAVKPRNEDTEGDSSDEESADEESAGGMLGGSRGGSSTCRPRSAG
ncbi:unnamed protein product, partial [Laminaria digitata]